SIPTRDLWDFVEHDYAVLLRKYSRTMAADVGLARKFGRPDMQPALDKVRDAFNARIRAANAAGDRSAAARLQGQRKNRLRDIEAMRDRIRGTYGLPKHPEGLAHRAFTTVRTVNHLRLMGGVQLASLAD